MLRAFASGCTALAGIEAVSNGVENFKEPAHKTARGVLLAMALIVGSIFLGVSALMSLYRIVPTELSTTFSLLAAAVFGRASPMFHVVQLMTVVILMLAANTAFADLPHLMAMMAKDGYLPRRMVYRGSRLNYSNGIAFLFSVSALLVVVFRANQHKLLPLFASGVFISFFLNQLGMLRYWQRRRDRGWALHGAVNALALCATTVTLCVLILTRFLIQLTKSSLYSFLHRNAMSVRRTCNLGASRVCMPALPKNPARYDKLQSPASVYASRWSLSHP